VGPARWRDCLASTNDCDTITFAVTGTITLTSGELVVSHSITISGPGAADLAVNGNATSRVFHISAGETVSISGLTVTNGFVASGGQGGGVWNDHATLTLSNCTVTTNSSSGGHGGGIINDAFDHGSATLEIDNCTISNNSALCSGTCPDGGGIYNQAFNGPGSASPPLDTTSPAITAAVF
jgi:hypothetical protein